MDDIIRSSHPKGIWPGIEGWFYKKQEEHRMEKEIEDYLAASGDPSDRVRAMVIFLVQQNKDLQKQLDESRKELDAFFSALPTRRGGW